MNQTNGLFQGETVFIFLMTHATTLAPARTIDWDAVDQLVKNNILQVLTEDEQFVASAMSVNNAFTHAGFSGSGVYRQSRTL
jgi:hypothetical protein